MSDRRKTTQGRAGKFAGTGAVYTVSITDLSNLGYGVGRLPADGDAPGASDAGSGAAGKVIFVRGAVTGDTVETAVIKETAGYLVGRLVRVVTPSPLREPAQFCTAPEACGGCVFRHLTYAAELESKHRRVQSAFRQAGLADVRVLPPLSTGRTAGYRNKGMYPVQAGRNGMQAGFYAAKSHRLIPCADCALQPPAFAGVVGTVCRFCDREHIPAYDETTGAGILRHIYLRTTAAGEIMVCLVINADGLPGGRAAEARLVDCLLAEQPRTVSVLLNINRRNTNVVLGEQYRKLYGSGWIEDTLCGLRFRLSAGSFYQVNREGAELLYETAARMAEVRGGESLWDLYCGAGTIGLSMLSPGRNARPAQVTGVEIVPEAVACAEQNARLNAEAGRIPPDAAHFFCADAGDAAALFAAADTGAAPAPDIVIIDPPRKGTTPELIRELARRGVPRVVYVSCDPETLARDCALFRGSGYAVGEVQPVDMFPRTGHVETVVLLSKGEVDSKKIRGEFSLEDMDMS